MLPMELLRRVGIESGGARPGGGSQAIARRLAGAGMKIVLVDVDSHVQEFAVALRESEAVQTVGGDVIAVVGNLADTQVAARAVETCLHAFGRVDFVLNVAGGSDPALPTTCGATSADHYRLCFDKNVVTATNLTVAAIPALKQCGTKADVLFVSSVNGAPGWPWAGEPALAASKAGVEALTLLFASELRSAGINVNCLRLASVPNPHSPTWFKRLSAPNVQQRMRELYGASGALTAEQVAVEVAHMLNSEAAPRTGQIIVLDPGGIGTLGTAAPRPDGKWWL